MEKFNFKTIDQMSGREVFCVERLRSLTFVTEQKITLPELDDEDLKAIHVYYLDNEQTIANATCRIFKDKNGSWWLGRVAVLKDTRGQHLGQKMLEAVHNYLKDKGVKQLSCHAQLYVKNFYEKLGYQTESKIFREGGVDHILMHKNL